MSKIWLSKSTFNVKNDANLSKTIFIKEYQFRPTFCYWYFLSTLIFFKTLYFLKWCPICEDSQQVWKVEFMIMNSLLKNECRNVRNIRICGLWHVEEMSAIKMCVFHKFESLLNFLFFYWEKVALIEFHNKWIHIKQGLSTDHLPTSSCPHSYWTPPN